MHLKKKEEESTVFLKLLNKIPILGSIPRNAMFFKNFRMQFGTNIFFKNIYFIIIFSRFNFYFKNSAIHIH